MRQEPTTPAAQLTYGPESGIGELMVADVLRRWPASAAVFVRRRLACVGCAMAGFERLADVPRVYGLDAGRFMRELRQAVDAGEAAQ